MKMISLVMANEPEIAQTLVSACAELQSWEAFPVEIDGQLWLENQVIEGENPVSWYVFCVRRVFVESRTLEMVR